MALQVNGETISNADIREQMAYIRSQLDSEGREASLEDRLQLRTQAVDDLIERVVMMQEARRLGLAPAAAEIETTAAQLAPRAGGVSGCRAGADVNKLRSEAERRLLLDGLLEYCWRKTPEPSPGEIRKYYQANRESFQMPEMVHAWHLVRNFDGRDRETELRRVSTLRERVSAGEDFATLARTESDCPENDGNLGWFPRGVMVEEFDDVIFAAEPVMLTEVFESRFGAHVALVRGRRPAGVPSLEELAETITVRLRRQKLDREIGRLVERLISQADIREIA